MLWRPSSTLGASTGSAAFLPRFSCLAFTFTGAFFLAGLELTDLLGEPAFDVDLKDLGSFAAMSEARFGRGDDAAVFSTSFLGLPRLATGTGSGSGSLALRFFGAICMDLIRTGVDVEVKEITTRLFGVLGFRAAAKPLARLL